MTENRDVKSHENMIAELPQIEKSEKVEVPAVEKPSELPAGGFSDPVELPGGDSVPRATP